ncbi:MULTISPECIES: hypothetical protein [unclassified Pseudomonas]|uniref:hypothetical protein n=1 Tax=unclassified Pseudomonas TaxID=196821 RepID=UPI0011BF3B45|nr:MULTISPECIES: hypothetical protein [unclassified Pseudomonas]
MEDTATGQIKWSIADAPYTITKGNDNFFPLYFQVEYRGRTMCIYEVRAKDYIEDQAYWHEYLVIGLLDNDGRLLWEYEGNDAILHELFGDVRRSIADVQDFLGYFR